MALCISLSISLQAKGQIKTFDCQKFTASLGQKQAFDLEVECGSLSAPLDYEGQHPGEFIDLNFVIIGSKLNSLNGKQIIYTDFGGPIDSGASLIFQASQNGVLSLKKDRVIIALDQRHEHSPQKIQNLPFYSSQSVAKDIFYLLDHLKIDKFNYFGVSYGGHIAAHLLTLNESRIRAMLLDSPTNVSTRFLQNDEITGQAVFFNNLDDLNCYVFSSCDYNSSNIYHSLLQYLDKGREFLIDNGQKIYLDKEIFSQFFYHYIFKNSNFLLVHNLFNEIAHSSFDDIGIILNRKFKIDRIFKPQSLEKNKSTTLETLDYLNQGFSLLNINFICEYSLSGFSSLNPPKICSSGKFHPLSISKNQFSTPTFLISGKLDAVTPSKSVAELATSFSHSYYKEFLFSNHGVTSTLLNDGCKVDLFDFFDHFDGQTLIKSIDDCANQITERLRALDSILFDNANH